MLNYRRNNENSMLLYNLAAIKNFKMKMFTEDENKKKQRNSVKIILITSELTQKGSLNEH